MTKEQRTKDGRKLQQLLRYMVSLSVLAIAFVLVKLPETAYASAVNYTINYETQVLDASATPGRVYISTDKERTWESLEDSGNVVDISSLLQTKAVEIYLKSNTSVTSTKVPLMEEPTTGMTAILSGSSITYSTNLGIPIEYQKGKNGPWVTLGISGTMSTKSMEIKGATISFRTKAIATRRAGKIITIRVAKRPAAPSVKLDGNKLSITGLKAGMQYRTASSGWLPVNVPDRANSVSIYTFNGVTSVNNTTFTSPFAANTLEFRVVATDKKPTSSSKVVVVPAQPIFIGSVSLNKAVLRINDNSGKLYEYTLLEPYMTLDLNKARWTAVKSNTDVTIKNASSNQILLIRNKSYVDKQSKLTVPASTVNIQTITL